MSFRSNSQKHNHSISKYNNHLFLFARQMRNRDRYIFLFSSITYDTKLKLLDGNNKIYHYQNLPIGFARIPFLNFIILWLNFFHKQTRLNFISWFPGWAGRDRISLSNYEFVQVLWLEYLHSWTQKKKILLGVNRMLYENGITALLSNWWMLNDYSAKLLFLVGNYYMDKFCGKL